LKALPVDLGHYADNRPMNWTPTRAAALALLWLLVACSPALNWRSVPLPEAGITILLPCKPDRATRTVELAGSPAELAMTGCEADGALWAVSHTALADPAQAGTALRHWRAAVLANLGAGAAATAVDTPFAPKGALPLPQSVRTVVQGQRGDGSAVFAQGVWFARAAGPRMRLYHAVVYTGRPRPELADQFFAGIVLP
jgi:hypothetical protein